MNRIHLMALLMVATLLMAAPASAQIVGANVGANAQASWNTATAGTMALRSPGNIISRARADFNQLHDQTIIRSRFGPTITAQPPDLTLDQQVRVDVIETLFSNLNLALAAFNAVLGGGAVLPGGSDVDLTSLLGTITRP